MNTNEFDINTCTIQEACDYAVRKIVEQGKQCKGQSGLCLYNDGEGNHCAYGWLQPDITHDLAVHELVEAGVGGLHHHINVPAFTQKYTKELICLQAFHDQVSKASRRKQMTYLQGKGIDTSAPRWQQWVDMGE